MDAQDAPAANEVSPRQTFAVISGQAGGIHADPKAALGIGVERLNVVVGQGTGRLAVRFVIAEAVTIPACETVFRSDPQKPVAIFSKRRWTGGVGQGVVRSDLLKIEVG
jgi:hypothetical protein